MLRDGKLGSARVVEDELRQLLGAARAGDRAAIEKLVRRYWGQAYRVGFLITQDAGAAEDTAQEAMVAAVQSLERFDLERPFRPWLNRIAANKAHDWVRRQLRGPEVIAGDEVALTAAEPLAAEIARDFPASAVAQALARLDLAQREAIVLRHLLDYEPKEIAEIVGVPAGTVRSRLHRGLARLRAELGTENEGSVDERLG